MLRFLRREKRELPTDPAEATRWQLFWADLNLAFLESQFPHIFGKKWPWSNPME